MNKRILRKIFWATALVLLLSVVVCFFVIYGITYFSKHETISKNMTVYNERIAGAEDFEQQFSASREYNSTQQLSAVQEELVNQMIDEIVEQIFNATVANW